MAELTVTELGRPERKYDPIWVINRIKPPNVGPLMINATDGDGHSITVMVPATFIPVDLTLQAERESITRSHDFRTAVHNGLLRLVDSEEAEKILGTKEGSQESRRIRNVMEDVMPQDTATDVNEKVKLFMSLGPQGNESALCNKLRLMDEEMDTDDWKYVLSTAEEHAWGEVSSLANQMLGNGGEKQ